MFRSAAKASSKALLALIMTGMGDDGVEGLGALKQAGAHVLAQDEPSSVVWGMPGSAVSAGLVDEVLPLGGLAERLLELAGGDRNAS
jgi:two-component system chemotaxis response regulator CheB